MSFVCDGKFAVPQSVPQLNCSIAGTGHNLAVVGGEGDGEDIVGVANKGPRGNTSGEFPETESFVPGARERIGTIGGDDLL